MKLPIQGEPGDRGDRGRPVQDFRLRERDRVTSSLATEGLKGKTIEEAGKIKNTDIVAELKLPPVKTRCLVLAEDAIKAALADFQERYGTVGAAASV